MRSTVLKIATGILFAALALAQSPDRTFYLTHPASPADLNAMTTMIRTIVDVRRLSVDQPHNAVIASQASVDQMAATDWLVHQLDQAQPASAPEEFHMAGEKGETIRVFRMDPSTSLADLTGLITAIRTTIDIPRMFPYTAQKALVVRGPADKVAAAEWVIKQATVPAGQSILDSPEYRMNFERGEEVVRVFHLRAGTTNENLYALLTAIRTIIDLQRLFPYESTAALVTRGPADKVTAAEWLIHELGKPLDQPAATHQTTLPGVTDGVVRVFYPSHIGSAAELTLLVTQIRAQLQIQRLFPYRIGKTSAVIVRGRPEQMSAVETMVGKFGADVQ